MAKKVVITLVKSKIGRLPSQRATIKALGLNKVNSKVEVELTPSVNGMVKKVLHLVDIKELN